MRLNLRASPLHAAVVGLSNAVIQCVSSFGVHMTSDENVSVTALVNAAWILVSVVLITSTNGSAAKSG